MGNRSMTADLLLDAVVERCDGVDQGDGGGRGGGHLGGVRDAGGLGTGASTRSSVGAVVWREFLGSFNFASAKDYGPLFSVPFDAADDPVATQTR